jgi:hypothetical protein
VIPPARLSPALGFEPFGAAVGLSVISGSLAIVLPYLTVLTGTLAALAVAAWAAEARRDPRGAFGRRRPAGWAVVAAVGGAGLLYLVPPETIAPFRSLLLALALVLLWAVETDLGRTAVRGAA